jgi:hypothetical protein
MIGLPPTRPGALPIIPPIEVVAARMPWQSRQGLSVDAIERLQVAGRRTYQRQCVGDATEVTEH